MLHFRFGKAKQVYCQVIEKAITNPNYAATIVSLNPKSTIQAVKTILKKSLKYENVSKISFSGSIFVEFKNKSKIVFSRPL